MPTFISRFTVPVSVKITVGKHEILRKMNPNDFYYIETLGRYNGEVSMDIGTLREKRIFSFSKLITNKYATIQVGKVDAFSLGSGKVRQNNSTPMRLGSLKVINNLEIPLHHKINNDYSFTVLPKSEHVTYGDVGNDDPGIAIPSVLYNMDGIVKNYEILSNVTDIVFGGIRVEE